MAYHFIAIANYYTGGFRIGWHYASNDNLDKAVIQDFLSESNKRFSNSEYGVHKLLTNSISWDSVVEKDSFFKDVIVIEEKEAFFDMLESDKKIDVMDIAKFFLSFGSLTNLKLQKLIYFSYATHLVRTGKKLFDEPIVAFKYGPVVKDVYHIYKDFGRESINIEDDGPKFHISEFSIPVSLAKIALNESSSEILLTLTEVIESYWDKTASKLVNISHVAGGPWDHAYKDGKHDVIITDELIKKYHYKEKTQVC
ncbi:hypothetical protein UCY_01452 [Enterococcus faecalis EnGen0252]|nr:type II toxin-antitoxin system antitoxin SocA domain-containing protein [Enterococcus faecalis]EOD87865.1 hypothetical protein Q93_01190 [Enterococcus faecalis EnGen0065]EOF39403.1 hypothetical protein SC9_01522 [Enterococcus faecalis EnGen0101]EOH64386.1 hypothetical protein UA9_01497 [Enterococcus faecalis EnGen0235]EOI22382.1 hypothetical protein UCY_01452 [Enterococcus faecalis EnGen0252]EOK23932.1 hypothetical protein WQ3_01474 [Enterococcus faecalis EnGen0338]EOL77578.1 hypothetical 